MLRLPGGTAPETVEHHRNTALGEMKKRSKEDLKGFVEEAGSNLKLLAGIDSDFLKNLHKIRPAIKKEIELVMQDLMLAEKLHDTEEIDTDEYDSLKEELLYEVRDIMQAVT